MRTYFRASMLIAALFITASSFLTPATLSAQDPLWARTDALCKGEYGEKGCEKSDCDTCLPGNCGQCDARYCNASNCGI